MTSPLANLEPKHLWQHFDQIRQIPRPSRHEEAIRTHVKAWAERRKFEWVEDEVGNVCVRVPGTQGHENASVVIIQGHLDMVPEKDSDFEFDFTKDPIACRVDGDWVVADKTTLGADNGIGIAAAMAAADDPDVVHGPLELLFTIDEETGLTGATNLDGSILKGKIMLNLDSEEDGVLFVGCAGGCTSEIQFDLPRVSLPSGYVGMKLEVTGLKGGHSGLNIIDNRANSIKVLCRVLGRWLDQHDVFIESIDGGNKHNAIPREATAVVAIPSHFVESAKTIAAEEQAYILTEFKTIDGGLTIRADKAEVKKVASAEASRRLVAMLTALPDGVSAMSRDIAGLVETSSNLAIASTDGDKIAITTSSRSSVASALRGVLDEAKAVVALAGGVYTEVGAYPAWQPNMDSKLLGVCQRVYKQLFGKEPKVAAIHAGLECGIIGEKIGSDADMISFGPELQGVHAPGEKVKISTVVKFWDFYKKVLADLA
ncbi:MAG TPA: aminoacyl-histidine dipeptidase [Polyangiaceae bacterium]|jgi:dipeptidase D|nr:MAG: Cytosol non-specific dipeptidase [Deltaproteobacteria bacterium ADurb.Bin207]HNS98382.1 aminoacyl-histidine dipeptidase [Polyangiaceae bacterium]HNZ22855.1 aminoacyl-histidine dipeptidase [Polyangiaceae bacterium]HOD21314.1 aminoacyl-histidine dipeptidase [Polyangiaceae bacterium]HOE48473.1 aminoacyl-histidine dipeptidase [Polyangiaceae bacterium]